MAGLPGILMVGNGTSAPVLINPIQGYSAAPFNPTPSWSLGIIVTVSSGASLTYTVQVTADPKPSANGFWNPHDTLSSLTSSANGNVAFPITAVRLVVSGYSSGSVNCGICLWP